MNEILDNFQPLPELANKKTDLEGTSLKLQLGVQLTNPHLGDSHLVSPSNYGRSSSRSFSRSKQVIIKNTHDKDQQSDLANLNQIDSTQIISKINKIEYFENYSVQNPIFEKIVDWESRIASYSQETKELYKIGYQKFEELEDLFIDKSNSWYIKANSKKKGLDLFHEQCYCKKTGFPMIRVVSFTDHDPLVSLRAYADTKIRKQYDRNVKEYYLKQQLGANLFEAYQSTNRIITVEPRDCYHYILQKIDQDGTITCVMWNKEMPLRQGHVRMFLPIGGIRLTPLKNDSRGKTQFEFLMNINLMGIIPNWVQSQALGWTASGHLIFKQLIPQYIDSNPS